MHDGHDGPHHHHHHPKGTDHAHEPFSPVACGVITVSDARTAATDEGGPVAVKMLAAAGHHVTHQTLVRNDGQAIRDALYAAITAGARAVVITGGTGLSSRDRTVETLTPLVTKPLDGFGELFRMLSYEQIGPLSIASRAMGGAVDQTLVFALPGSPWAVELAVEKLIAPALSHLVRQLSR